MIDLKQKLKDIRQILGKYTLYELKQVLDIKIFDDISELEYRRRLHKVNSYRGFYRCELEKNRKANYKKFKDKK